MTNEEMLMQILEGQNKINKRLDYIESLNNNFLQREELMRDLYEVYDLERLTGKVICGSLNGRDLLQIKNSIKVIPTFPFFSLVFLIPFPPFFITL